jgi:RNA polymerase sigma factor (sigma-70 family)
LITAAAPTHHINLKHPRHQPLARAEEVALVAVIRRGGPAAVRARRRLLDAHLKFVVAVAKQFWNKGLPMEDLIQAGFLGLNRAADIYDPRTCKFTSYAVWWIRQSILKALHGNGVIVTPGPSYLKVRQKIADRFRAKGDHGHADGIEAVIKSTQALRTLESSEELFEAGWEPTDPDADPVARLEASEREAAVDRLLACLRPKERDLIRLSFGLDTGHKRTLQEVGDQMGVSRERIRQVQALALEKMRVAANRDARLALPKKGGA